MPSLTWIDVLSEILSPATYANRETAPGKEKQIALCVKKELNLLDQNNLLKGTKTEVKQVRFVSMPNQAQGEAISTSFYVATIEYDIASSPLTVESGATLLTAACSCGVDQIRLSDSYDIVKTFRCPNFKK